MHDDPADARLTGIAQPVAVMVLKYDACDHVAIERGKQRGPLDAERHHTAHRAAGVAHRSLLSPENDSYRAADLQTELAARRRQHRAAVLHALHGRAHRETRQPGEELKTLD